MTTTPALCELCGEPMPAGEEMFKFHGFSCECPKPPLPRPAAIDERYDQGRRDVLNAILALNPKAAQKLHILHGGTETFDNHAGRLPFDVVFWVTEVAEQLGIKPKDDA